MSLNNHIFSENIKEIETLIKEKFSNDLRTSLGHDNIDFKIENIHIKKANIISVNILADERHVIIGREINYSGINERRTVNENDIKIFSYDREDYSLNNSGVASEFRVEGTNETEICHSCNGRKSETCSGCSGSGRNRCSDCQGQRQVQCTSCYGKGETTCWWCSGGYKTEYDYDLKRDVRKRCGSCNGRGVDPCTSCSNGYITCSGCNGNGEITCYSCNGRGEVDCDLCSATGSFTNFLKVNSILKVMKDNLIIKGNVKKEVVSRKVTEEDFIYEKTFINYKLNQLKEYSNDLKEITSRLQLKENQLPHSIYFSLDELASLSFQIIINDSVYDGGLKDGELWIDPSVINLLFYDIIDGLNIDKRFSNILSNKKSLQNNITDSDKIFPLIEEYNNFEDLINSKDSVNSKIHKTRKKKLINVNLYLEHLYTRFVIKNGFFLVLISAISGLFSYINLSNEAIIQYGYLGLFFFQILAFCLSFIVSFSIKKSKPENLQIIIYLIVLTAGVGNYVYTQDIQKEFNFHINKEKEKVKGFNNFKQFKQTKGLIHKEELREILNNNSTGRYWMLSNFTSDSLILINPSDNLRYTHYIEAGSKFKMQDIAGATERIADDRVDFSIDHEDYIKNNKYKYQSKISVTDAGHLASWEIDPKDIRHEVAKIGINIMENSIDAFNENSISEYFFDIKSFIRFFPKSDLIKRLDINKKESRNQVIIDGLGITDVKEEIIGIVIVKGVCDDVGDYEFIQGENLLGLLNRAKCIDEKPMSNKVYVFRLNLDGTRTRFILDLAAILKDNNHKDNILLQENDIVRVFPIDESIKERPQNILEQVQMALLLDSINRIQAKLLTNSLSRKEKRKLKKQLKRTRKKYEEYKK